MQVTFLREAGGRPLSKEFHLDKTTGQLGFRNYYQQYSQFSSFEEQCSTIDDFHAVLAAHASKGHAIVKGRFTRLLVDERRAGLVDKAAPSQWLCLDFDGLQGYSDATPLLASMGMHDVDHIVQYSASYGMKPGFRAHVFLMLNAPISEPLLKQWFMWLNLNNPMLRPNLSLTSTGNSLRWPLDISLAENHRLIYIAPPLFEGVTDPFGPGGAFAGRQRIELVRRSQPTFDILAAVAAVDLSGIGAAKDLARDELRARAGLRKKRENLKHYPKLNVYVATSPDSATVTGYKEERGFVYLNLNGGNSWGYFHPTDSFEVIHNFKGEPAYLTKELLPDYYTECVARRRESVASSSDLTDSSETKYFYFTEKKSGAYYKGTWRPDTDTRELDPARSREQIRDFCLQNGLDEPAFIPIMDTVFDPSSPVFFDKLHHTINLYQPSQYKKNVRAASAPKALPTVIGKILHHVLNNDEETVDHFLNWVAYIWQTGKKSKTAWVLHGTTGTGKGVLMEQILKPLFGPEQALEITAQPLAEQFNSFLVKTQILMVDEADTDGIPNLHLVAAKLKNWITEDSVVIREPYKAPYAASNHTSFILASNKRNPHLIDHEDRRFSVAPRQEQKLLTIVAPSEFRKIRKELQDFANFLQAYSIDPIKAATPLVNSAKLDIQNTTTSTPDDVTRAVLEGNFRYFVELLPYGVSDASASPAVQVASYNFKKVLAHIYDHLVSDPGRAALNMSRDDLYSLFEYALDWRMRATKFSKTVSKFGLHFKPVVVAGKTVRGTTVTWIATAEDLQVYRDLLTPDRSDNINPLRKSREAS